MLLYVALCVVVHLANRVARRVVDQTPAMGDELPELDAYELALLAGGPQRAIATTTAVLVGRGVVRDGTAPATVALKGHLAADADALERAVGADLRRAGQLAPAELQCAGATRAELQRIEHELTRRGLLIGPRAAAVAQWLYVGGPLALLTIGGAWLATHWDYYNDEPMRWVMLITIGVGVVAVEHLVTFVARRGRRLPTALGRAALAAANSATGRSPGEQLALTTALQVDEPAHDVTASGSSTVLTERRHADASSHPAHGRAGGHTAEHVLWAVR